MASFKLPSDFFLEEAIKEYSGSLEERLAQELLQNLWDAGATRADFKVEGKFLDTKDNGSGMNRFGLENGLLTGGGSIKGENATGFAGAAKKLIILSHESYRVRTQDLQVDGGNPTILDYEITDGLPFYQGTIIQTTFSPQWPDYENVTERMIAAIKKVVSLCNIQCQVYLNGVLLRQATLGVTPIENEFATIRERAESGVIVRFNGLYMFSRPAPGAKSYWYDCKALSKDALTQNRENFRYESPHYSAFNKFINSLAQNSSQGLSGKMAVARAPKDKVFNGVKYRGEKAPDKMTKEHKTLFCLAAAVSHTLGVKLNKDNLGFFFDDCMMGMCESGRYISLNPDKLVKKEWNEKSIGDVISTVLHEITHSNLIGWRVSDHDESFATKLEIIWQSFLMKWGGISPLMALARRYRKLYFPMAPTQQVAKKTYIAPRRVVYDTPESWD